MVKKKVQEKEITKHSIYSFLNGEKVIKVGGIYQKYLSKLCVESKNKEILSTIESKDEVFNSGLNYFLTVTTNPYELSEDNLELRWGELGLLRSWTEYNDAFWCKNKRKATFTIGTLYEVNYFNDPFVGQLTQIIVARIADVTARRKGIPCIWYKYKTKIIWNGFHAEYDINRSGNISHDVWTHADEVQEDVKSITRDDVIYVYYNERYEYCDVMWTDIQTKATTTGIWDKWIKVDWHN